MYQELASYFIACVEELQKKQNINIHIFKTKTNSEAPFQFNISSKIKIYDRENYSYDEMCLAIEKINPDLIFLAGWGDKGYLKIVKRYRDKIPTILGFDNNWEGNIKQIVLSWIAPFFLTKYFSYAFVPGKNQARFAKKIMFRQNQILEGAYSADYNLFNSYYQESDDNKKKSFPKRFIYTGRYVKHKGIFQMWQAFIELQNEQQNEWELWCIGTGDQFENRVFHPKIKHFGFVQPADLKKYLNKTGVFILPSEFEPWGVVVHEFAAAGFPLLCSREVGAASKFLIDGKNGFLFEAEDITQLKKVMKKIIKMCPNELINMGKESTKLAKQITPEKWAKTILSILK